MVAAATWAGWRLLRRLRFDTRLERAHDIAALAAVGGVVVAGPVAWALGAAAGGARPRRHAARRRRWLGGLGLGRGGRQHARR